MKFYNNITQTSYEIGIYQCELLEKARICLRSQRLKWEEYNMACDYKKYISFLLLLYKQLQNDFFALDKTLQEGGLDYVHYSK